MKFFVKLNYTLLVLVMVVGILSIPVFALDVSEISANSTSPSSCQEIRDNDSTAGDGNYTILSDSHVIEVYCAKMSTAPAEYISLVQTGGSYNYSKGAAGGAWYGSDVITKYTKVRFDPALVRIIHTDRTFSTSTGYIYGNSGTFSSVNYGSASTCVWNPQLGTANLDLTGTDVTFAPDQFHTAGWNAAGTTTYSNGNQVVNLTGGGYCGGTGPINPYIQLDWQYQALEMSATAVNTDGQATVTTVLKDAAGLPVANQIIRFNSSLGNIDAESVTDANGVATAVVTILEVGTAQIEAVSATGGSYGTTSVEVEMPTQTLIIYGANGTPGATDAHTEFSLDGGQTWQAAYLYGSHPWGFVSGTNSWINCVANGQSCLNMEVLYRIQFSVPDDATNAEMTFDLKADNYATVWLNDTYVTDVVGQNSTNLDASIASVIQPGLNTILINVTDEGGWAGLNYKITLNINAPTAPVLVDPAPTAEVNYSTTAPTNMNVLASIISSEPVTVTNNGGSASYTFSENGSFTFQFVDSAGNTGEATAIVSNIDKIAPVITVDAYNTAPTNQDVVVTASANEGTLNAASHTFTENDEFTFTATDAVGNVTNETVIISNIDKVAPVITIDGYNTDPTNNDIKVTASTNEGTLNAASHTFTENGEYTFTAIDAAGNVTNETVIISNIDKVAPVITIDGYNTDPTNNDIKVTASTNEGTLNAASHTFTENGEYTFTAIDAAGNVTNETVTISNIDKVAPTLSISVDNAILKVPNHKLVPIQVTVNGSDANGSGVKSIILTSITSNEVENGLGDGNTTEDIQGADFGTSDTSFNLRSERSGKGTDRVYTITYTITDFAGNTSTATATVTVPKGSK